MAWVLRLCFSASHTWLISSARADANLFQVRKLRLGVYASLNSLLDEQAPPHCGGQAPRWGEAWKLERWQAPCPHHFPRASLPPFEPRTYTSLVYQVGRLSLRGLREPGTTWTRTLDSLALSHLSHKVQGELALRENRFSGDTDDCPCCLKGFAVHKGGGSAGKVPALCVTTVLGTRGRDGSSLKLSGWPSHPASSRFNGRSCLIEEVEN